jgi:hypothetical protein
MKQKKMTRDNTWSSTKHPAFHKVVSHNKKKSRKKQGELAARNGVPACPLRTPTPTATTPTPTASALALALDSETVTNKAGQR